MIDWPVKAPEETLDYAFNFGPMLAEGETIASKTVTPTGVTVNSSAISGALVKVWVAGGVEGDVATIACAIVTSAGRHISETARLPIAVPAVSLARAKAHLRVDFDDDDTLIEAYLEAAVAAVEDRSGRVLSPRGVTQLVKAFPGGFANGPWCGAGSSDLVLNRGPVIAIVSIGYVDGDGVAQTLAPDGYRAIDGDPYLLVPPASGRWPVTEAGHPRAVTLRYLAGYAAGMCPAPLLTAVLLLVGHYYRNREAVVTGSNAGSVELPQGVNDLIWPYRRRLIG